MAVGIDLRTCYLGLGDDYVLLEVSSRRDGVKSGVSQRVYASGQQRAIIGYSSKDPYDLVAQEVDDETWEWLDTHTSQRLFYRDPTGIALYVVLGNVTRTIDATFEQEAFDVNIQMYVQETVGG